MSITVKHSRDALRAGIEAAMRSGAPNQREAEITGIDEEARTVEIAFSSDAEFLRWWGYEVLSHADGAVSLERINDGGALCWNHNTNDQRGVVVRAWIDPDGKGRAIVKFSRSVAGEELFRDVLDGIKTKVSVGYFVHEWKVTGERDDIDIVTVMRWEPYEISFVSVPLDTTVGLGRSADVEKKETRETCAEHSTANLQQLPQGNERMSDPKEQTENQVRQATNAATTAERDRARAIQDAATKVGKNIDGIDDMVRDAIRDGRSVAEFNETLLDAVSKRAAKPLNEQLRGCDVGMSDTEIGRYSILNVVRHLADPTDRESRKAAGFEIELSEAARDKQSHKSQGNFVIPTDVLRSPILGSRALNTSKAGGAAGNTGGFLVATDLQAQSFIDVLRRKSTILRRAFILAGLVGNIDIPKKTSASQAYWLTGEDGDAQQTGMELGQLSMNPKTVAAFSEITRRMLKQSSLDAEALVRIDLATAQALEIDRAGYYGTGTNGQPKGIANFSGINVVDLAAANGLPTFAELVAMETQIASDDADVDTMAYVAPASFRGHAKTTLKFEGVSGTIWEPGNSVNGYPCDITNQIQAGDQFLGNFADLIVGMWGGLEMSLDPYSGSKSGRLRITTFQDVDYALRRAESFALGRYIP